MTKTLLAALAGASLCGVATAATPLEWYSDPVGTSMLLTFNHSKLIDVSVLASGVTITAAAAADAPQFSPTALHIDVDLHTLTSYNARWPQQLQSAEFFDVAQTPNLSFQATHFKRTGDGWRVSGTLSAHGVSRPVTWHLTATPTLYFGGRNFLGLTLRGEIPWHQFGLTFADRAGLKDHPEFGDPFQVIFNCELVDVPPAAPQTQPAG